jgi:hypothetical protein
MDGLGTGIPKENRTLRRMQGDAGSMLSISVIRVEPVVVGISACEQQLRGASSSLTTCPWPVQMVSVRALCAMGMLWMHHAWAGEEIQPVHQSTHTGD